jgi:hypothetical protein
MEKCGHDEVTGILLNDPEWLQKEQLYEKCKKCRAKGERRNAPMMSLDQSGAHPKICL